MEPMKYKGDDYWASRAASDRVRLESAVGGHRCPGSGQRAFMCQFGAILLNRCVECDAWVDDTASVMPQHNVLRMDPRWVRPSGV